MKSKNPKIAILIVLFNEGDIFINLINSLIKQTYKNYELYLINNGEDKKLVAMFREYFPDSVIFSDAGNIGFGAGNNLLAERAINDSCDYLYVLNPDMELSNDTIEKLVEVCDSDKNIGMCNCTILYGNEERETEKIQLFGCKANYRTQSKKFLFSGEYLRNVNLPGVLEVEYINAGSLFISSEVVKKIGLFDEDFFMYNEEIDLAYRVKKSGYKIIVMSGTKIWHHHRWDKDNIKGYNLMYYYMMRNRYLYFYKYKLYFFMVLDLIWQIISFPLKLNMFYKISTLKTAKYYYLGITRGILREKGRSSLLFE